MTAPEVFSELCFFMYWEFPMQAYPTIEEGLKYFFDNHSASEISNLKVYLNYQLENMTLEQIEAEWEKTPSDLYYFTLDKRKFYEVVLQFPHGGPQ